MKGTIIKCLQEMVEKRHAKQDWQDILAEAGFDGPQFFNLSSDVDDAQAIALFGATGEILGLSHEETAKAFGDYWVNEYAARVYQTIYMRMRSARDFILALDGIHQMVTSTIENAHPPRFEYQEQGADTLLVTYKSKRNLIDLYIGLAYGVGRYFETPLEITKLSARQVRIKFP